jgi:hypothetical protein
MNREEMESENLEVTASGYKQISDSFCNGNRISKYDWQFISSSVTISF